ncbi:hypothetical protein Q9R32_05305 [Actinotalea sp. AC32]|nr:hypothetical protein [Actinotalea sp. AC32]
MHDDLLTLPRSVVLALWARHVGAGAAPLQHAVRCVEGDDEPHAVVGGTPGAATGAADDTLAALLAAWAAGPRTVAAVLPVPGDPAGAPASVSAAALDAGECVLVQTPDGAVAAVPEVTVFGSALEPGHLVTWHVRPVEPWSTALVGRVGSPAEAELELRHALGSATEALTSLDVARWRPDAAAAIARLRGDEAPRWDLPAELEPRRVRVLTLAARLRGIVALATSDDGGAVNLWQADQRSTALREVDRAARRAMSAVTVG